MNKVWLIGQLADRKGKRVDPTALAICHNNHHKINKKGDVALTTSPDNKNLATTGARSLTRRVSRCREGSRYVKANKKGDAELTTSPDNKNLATTYSPTYYRSTISAGGLNFSVRKGKRWTPPL